jgi:uncharacterized membrane protein YphA (DoxX/SURF4 family)
MKKVLLFIRWIVGVLFIFSGLIKVNDPLGLSYKMQEFFEVWGIDFVNKYSLFLALIMNMLEVSCGIALLIGFRIKFTIRLLLALIIFFTFLTGYAVLSGKIKTCGCLGDCLPLTATQSFIKDLVLLAMIVLLTLFDNDAPPLFSKITTNTILMLSIMSCVLIQDAVLNYLPYIDCLPFKVGNNLIEQMQRPKDYVPDSTVITYQYKKGGKVIDFDQSHFPDDFDSTYIFVNRYDKLVRKGTGGAKITDFNLTTQSGNDTTQAMLSIPKYLMVMGNSSHTNFNVWHSDLLKVRDYCTANNISLFYITPQSGDVLTFTVIDTMMYSNPNYQTVGLSGFVEGTQNANDKTNVGTPDSNSVALTFN